MSLPESEKRNPYVTTALVAIRRYEEKSSEEIAKELHFDSVEQMRALLQSWDLPDFLVGAETNQSKKKARTKSVRRMRELDSAQGLPPASNAIPLFKERLEALLENVELLEHMDEDLRGKYFVRTSVERVPVFYPRERYSKAEWDKLCAQHDLDPDDEGFWDTKALIKLPGGVVSSPAEIEATLIGVYALAGGRMDLILDALHYNKPPLGSETWEQIRLCIEGSKADGDKRDGLQVLARHLATWVRGGEVGPGRPAGLSEADHAFACRITYYRNQGLTDEEIARKESHRKKEDGTSYSIEDVTELEDLGLSWS